jgi:hypothetical protein
LLLDCCSIVARLLLDFSLVSPALGLPAILPVIRPRIDPERRLAFDGSGLAAAQSPVHFAGVGASWMLRWAAEVVSIASD